MSTWCSWRQLVTRVKSKSARSHLVSISIGLSVLNVPPVACQSASRASQYCTVFDFVERFREQQVETIA